MESRQIQALKPEGTGLEPRVDRLLDKDLVPEPPFSAWKTLLVISPLRVNVRIRAIA